MPHVVVKLAAGRSETQKAKLAEQITRALTETAGVGEESVSVAIEDIPMSEWTERVYKPEILPNLSQLYKKPGYDPLKD
jgi:4-oxalocrotonate tautomerase